MVAKAAEWIGWAGGSCPVQIGQRVQYRARGGFESGVFTVTPSEYYSVMWAHNTEYDPSTDIIEYRVVTA